jgi:hypothetical protein
MSAVTQPGSEPTRGEGLYTRDRKHSIYQKMYEVPLRDMYIGTVIAHSSKDHSIFISQLGNANTTTQFTIS